MRRFQKTGLLAILLAAPVLIYLFLRFFGDNQYALPVITSAVDATGAAYPLNGAPPFALADADGRTLPRDSVAGRLYVAHFPGAACADSCRLVMTQLSRANDFFKNEPDFWLLTHLPNAAPASELAAAYGAQRGHWRLLIAPPDTLAALARGYGLTAGPGGSTTLVLIDRRGQVRGNYLATRADEVDRLILEAQILLRNGG